MKYLIRISYDGSKFYGFQRLNDQCTVQKSLEEALMKIDGREVLVKGAGRTDRGVHANDQCVHFELSHSLPEDGLLSILNKLVGPYIHIKSCEQVKEDFHARFSVQRKVYRYRIYFGEYNPQIYDYVYEVAEIPNIQLMKEASKYFIGVHDFCHFVSGERDDSTSCIFNISFVEIGDYLDLVFEGKSFYRYMVRNIVGALLDIGYGKRDIQEIKLALGGSSMVKQFTTAVSNGLYLEQIEY